MTDQRTRIPRVLLVVALLLLSLVGGAVAGAAEPEWNIARVGGPRSATRIVVAVVDTGVDPAHPAFGARVMPAIDVVGDGNDGDPHGHGTHVAGTAAGADNGCGSIGIAPDARILPVRVLDENGSGTVSDVAEGIRRAADAGAHVINLSLGEDVVLRQVYGPGLDEAIEYAWAEGSIPVLAAGNDAFIGTFFGTGYEDLPVVVVTATDNQDRRASYAPSVGDARWGIAAPGGDNSQQAGRDIFSAFPDARCALSAGTSMAAPHVSGALAVLRRQGLGPQQAVERLLATARDIGPESTFGAGLLDLAAAAGTAGTTTTTVAPTTAPATTQPSGTTGGGAPSTTEASSPTAAPTGGSTADTGGTSSTTTTVAPTTTGDDPDTGDASSTTSTEAADDLSAGAVVTDEDDDPPAALVALAALGALAVTTGAGAAVLRARRGVQP